MDASPFGKLPGELRNRIYHLFFAAQLSTPIQIDIRNTTTGPRLKLPLAKTRSALALAATSRQLRAETLPIFWSSATIRIVTDTLTTYSFPNATDQIRDVLPLNRAHHINQDRADALATWLARSGIAAFAPITQPIELDLGVWDPQANARLDNRHEARILRLVGEDALALSSQILALHGGGSGKKGGGSSKTHRAKTTLRFGVHIKPSTAMGPIRVPNGREQAMAAIGGLCEARLEKVEACHRKGLLTDFGRRSLVDDIVLCRSAAEMLVPYIVVEAEGEEEGGEDGDEDEVGGEGRVVRAGSSGCK